MENIFSADKTFNIEQVHKQLIIIIERDITINDISIQIITLKKHTPC